MCGGHVFRGVVMWIMLLSPVSDSYTSRETLDSLCLLPVGWALCLNLKYYWACLQFLFTYCSREFLATKFDVFPEYCDSAVTIWNIEWRHYSGISLVTHWKRVCIAWPHWPHCDQLVEAKSLKYRPSGAAPIPSLAQPRPTSTLQHDLSYKGVFTRGVCGFRAHTYTRMYDRTHKKKLAFFQLCGAVVKHITRHRAALEISCRVWGMSAGGGRKVIVSIGGNRRPPRLVGLRLAAQMLLAQASGASSEQSTVAAQGAGGRQCLSCHRRSRKCYYTVSHLVTLFLF